MNRTTAAGSSSADANDRLLQRIAELEQENASLRLEAVHLASALQAMVASPIDDEDQPSPRPRWRVIQGGRT